MDLEQELDHIADEYRSDGYYVVTHPDRDHLPDFAKDLGVDLMATRGDRKVLIQVKRDRSEVQADQRVQQLADVVLSNPPWRNDLIILQKEDPINQALRQVGEPSPEKIREMLGSVDNLLKTYDSSTPNPNLREAIGNAAFVMAWASLEAAMRRVCSDAELYMPRYTPGELMRTLYSNGIMNREQFEFLRDTFRIRNEIVHGLNSPPVDSQITKKVGEIARCMLDGPQEPSAEAG